ncbi:MAG: 23S rRNA (adenine(2503)-C(2))-methyltransferase RlmN [Armatimonadetes bacterium]|nr:23S rRNA (adenine(2503)-C(2))-methyltransferase RlmN [Armatimonadota bacterium]
MSSRTAPGNAAPQPLPDLRGMTLPELGAFAVAHGEPVYRGRQLAAWVHARGVGSVERMTDLPEALRARLASQAAITSLHVAHRAEADGGDTIKYLLACADGSTVESVFMRYDDGRRSVCVSTQVGCAMACSFCATGLAGLTRNLTAAEIVDQVHAVQRDLGERVNHVVFMGMGEPLANYDATVRAVRLLAAPYGLRLSARHLTVSTVGLAPQIDRLAGERLPITLAVSLHAATDAVRSRLVPINRQFPLDVLLAACRRYGDATRRRLTFEYVLLAGENDGADDARALGARLRGLLGHVNLIPWNPVPGMPHRRPSASAISRFARTVGGYGVATTVRLERGVEIMAACGQLRRAQTPGIRPRRIAPAVG